MQAIKQVAAKLDNTPSVCCKCYVHPAVLDCYMRGAMLDTGKRKVQAEVAMLVRLQQRIELAVE